MIRISNIKLPLDHDEPALVAAILSRLEIRPEQLQRYEIRRRGYDARNKRNIYLVYSLDLDTSINAQLLQKFAGNGSVKAAPEIEYKFVAEAPTDLQQRPLVIGFGPCGLLAGLVLAQMGYKPLIIERGKEVRERTKDTFGFWREKKLNTESNVQFGEGGAGTFSDGKLSTQIKDPKQYGRKVLTEFVAAGVDDLHIEDGRVTGITLADGQTLRSNHIALAIGHSARDTFQMLYDKKVHMQAKPFSIGFRIEHQQSLIDSARFGKYAGHPILGSADYKLVHHCSNGRSVYSFCMCPGGTVVAAASEEQQVVTNGMSQYSRQERNANSAIVVGIDPSDYPGGPLAGIDLQRQLERTAYRLGGENYDAPAQKVGDFLRGESSETMGAVTPSFKPGVKLTDLSTALPDFCIEALREALPAFNRQIKGFAQNDALLTGVETRTSSPLVIKRNPDDLQSINTQGLYPGGEGAGYAGGIMSAAIDGIKIAEAIALSINQQQSEASSGPENV